MNLLILKGFNNYFNRIIKRYTTLSDYTTHSDSSYDFSNINFNPNDGVTTSQVIGSENQKQTGGPDPVPLAWEHDGNPDYLIAYETQKVGNTTINTIKSRWFIVESVRTRNGQYSLKLKRDSIADHLDTLASCPAFIKKGTVSDDNPLILNDEGISVNQIKSGQEYLKDELASAWIVGYMPKNTGLTGHTISVTVQGDSSMPYVTIEDLASELGVDEGELSDALTDSKSNITKFINGNIEFGGYVNHPSSIRSEDRLNACSQNYLTSITYKTYKNNLSGISLDHCFASRANNYATADRNNLLATIWGNAVNASIGSIKSNWNTLTGETFLPKKVYTTLVGLVGKFIRKNGQYYKLHIGESNPAGHVEVFVSSSETPFNTICSTAISNWNTAASSFSGYNSGDVMTAVTPGSVQIYYNTIEQCFYLTPVGPEDGFPTVSFSMSSNRRACYDQCYDMFAIPFGEIEIVDGLNTYNGIGAYAQRLAVAIAGAAQGLDNDNPDLYALYDIQLLPYCPIPKAIVDGQFDLNYLDSDEYDLITYSGQLTYLSEQVTPTLYSIPSTYEARFTLVGVPGIGSLTTGDITALFSNEHHMNESISIVSQSAIAIVISVMFNRTGPASAPLTKVQVSWQYNGSQTQSVVIYPSSASFETSVGHSLTAKDEMKIEAICNNYRLVSPNYQGSFDFNLAKNRGACSEFRAYCTYKPYTPYIRVVPQLDWMYGINYPKEARGLICNGDYSLGRVNTQWAQYQLNNKNYQNIFNREIQNLDVNQSIQRTQQYVSGGLNIVRDTIGGGVAGGIATGSPYGAIAGAAIGGIGSGIGYGMDMSLMEKGLQEQRQYAIDKYRMSLANIKAIPYTLTKVGAFDIDSAIFPILEYYTCSDIEKEALRKKIQYEGMTIGVVDLLGNYMYGGYVQADLIRNEAIIEDSHQLDDIYIELTKGVYM